MDEISSEMARLAKMAFSGGPNSMNPAYVTGAIALDVCKKHGASFPECMRRALPIVMDVKKQSDPGRQAEIDAVIGDAASRDGDGLHDGGAASLATFLAIKFGGCQLDYLGEAYDGLEKARIAREKGICNGP